ncbi:MAG: hypothetical protein O2890_03115 [Cyanobacteria bacterium]|nr:hypothetical protein [Cyanobacteriota bacterium]MDA0865405.1 hypothetical protein [Cyanobacteriota bacterium]
MIQDSIKPQRAQRSPWQALWQHLTVKGLILGAIALFLTTVSVDAFFHNALAAEMVTPPLELSATVSSATELSQSESMEASSPQTLERLSHNGLTHGTLTRHHLTSAHLFSAV